MKKILVMNFFPAFVPPASGGELRYFNMYSKLSAFFDITLLSPTYAEHKFEIVTHSGTFREYRIPKEGAIHLRLHHKLDQEGVCAEVSALVCALSSSYPNNYHKYYFELYESADLIVHESPYMVEYDILWGLDDKPRVYNSYNVEYLLMKQLYHGEKANAYLEYIFGLEEKAAKESDLLFATSEDEKNSFIELYGVPPEKIVLAPNGIDPEEIVPVAKRGTTSVLFIGSHHPPNVEAVEFIIGKVADRCPEVDFLIAGTCCDSFRTTPSVENVRLLGRVDEKTKKELLAKTDIALNPMFSGAGTNLKTLEFLSAGLPLVSTDTGVRGLGLRDGEHFLRADKDNFAKKLLELIGDTSLRERIGESGRRYVNDHYSWKNIADTVRASLERLPDGREKSRKRILLLNDYSAANPKGGGEVRINRLYGALSRSHDVLLLCLNSSSCITKSQITPAFTEVSFPKPTEHIAEEKRVDSTFWVSAADIVSSYMCTRNTLFLAALKAFYETADLIVLQHPYLSPALKTVSGKPLIYESHNFEYGLKKEILKDHPLFDTLIRQVEEVERAACARSSMVFGVSPEDIENLIRFSGIDAARTHLIRNGVSVRDEDFFSDSFDEVKKLFRNNPTVLFIGSGHSPNITALQFIIDSLAPALPHCYFLIVGTVCRAVSARDVPKNVLLFDRLDEAYKDVLLRVADVAVNPMSGGSGSNLKLAEYMANRLPTVTTKMGARGYDVEHGKEVVVCELPEFAGEIARLVNDNELRRRMSAQAYAYARRALDWGTLADEYFSILEKTVFRSRKKKLLVVTYRFTVPPLGGAEVYLLNVLRELDRIGDFSITVCTLDIHDIFNKFHFSAEYTHDDSVLVPPGMGNTSVSKFHCDRMSDELKLNNARRLFERWMDESTRSSLRCMDKYSFPMLLGGWHFPEESGGRPVIWSGSASYIYTAGTDELELEGHCPHGKQLSLSSDTNPSSAEVTTGSFHVRIGTTSSRWIRLTTSPSVAQNDPRPLGVRITRIRYLARGQWQDLKLNYTYRDFLKEEYLDEYIDELVGTAESRPHEYDDLFQSTRGPVSVELESWLDRNMKRFDVVLGHSIPFSTSVLATKHAREHGKPVMILPHFHMDDEFYHWKSYYDALRGATAVLASPLRSIELFFHKIGAKARYLPGGIDPAEHENVDAADFLSLYRGTLPFFLVLGRKSGSKHYHWVIDAVRDINRNKPVCSLVLIGKDEDGERIDARDALYLGERDRNVVLGALKECTALISMSESESFGIVILEAWMHKKPVIVNEQCAAFTELVEDGLDGLLANRVTLADKLGAVLQNPLKAREMGARGGEKVTEKFTWASIGKELNQLLRTISAKSA